MITVTIRDLVGFTEIFLYFFNKIIYNFVYGNLITYCTQIGCMCVLNRSRSFIYQTIPWNYLQKNLEYFTEWQDCCYNCLLFVWLWYEEMNGRGIKGIHWGMFFHLTIVSLDKTVLMRSIKGICYHSDIPMVGCLVACMVFCLLLGIDLYENT